MSEATEEQTGERVMAVPGADPAAPHECVFEEGDVSPGGGGVDIGPCIQCGAPYEGHGFTTSSAEVQEAETPDEHEPASDGPAPEQTAFSHGSINVPVSVPRSDADMAEQAVQIATLIAERTRIVEKKAASNKSFNAQIASLDEEIAQMGKSILDGHEDLKQGDLFADQAEAARTLADVAKAAGYTSVTMADRDTEITTTVGQDLAAVKAAEEADESFVCAMCDEEGLEGDAARFAKSESAFVDAQARRICPAHNEQLQRAAGCAHEAILGKLKTGKVTVCPTCSAEVRNAPKKRRGGKEARA